MQSEVRHELFLAEHGRLFDYDIEAAKPTVTLQAWRRLMQTHQPNRLRDPTCTLPTWSRLVADRTAFRTELAAEVTISMGNAKAVCQAVLNGAWASPHPSNSICAELGRDTTLRLMDSAMYKALRADFQVFWSELQVLNRMANLMLIPEGASPGQAISLLYNQIEDEIMSAADSFFEREGRHVWFVHDGFMSDVDICRSGLEEFISHETGYAIRFEMKRLCKSLD